MNPRVSFRRVCNCYPTDSRPLNIRIREMLFRGVPLGENPDVVFDFESSTHDPDNMTVDFDSDIHTDVFDKMERASYISHLNSLRSLSKDPAADPVPAPAADPVPAPAADLVE